MAEDTSVKFFTSDMPRTRGLVPNTLTSVTDILKDCLVNGFGNVTPTSASVTGGVCRVLVPDGSTFPLYSTVLCSGADQAGFNGEHKVARSANAWFEFNTTMADGAISGSNIVIKYAPAGWETPFGTTGTYTTFRSKSTNPKAKKYYLQVNEVAYNDLRVRGYKTMTDNTTGTIPFPDLGTFPNGYRWSRSNDNNASVRKWAVLANDRFFYWICAPYYSNDSGRPFSVTCFGDLYTDNVTTTGDVLLNGFGSVDVANSSSDSSNIYFGASHISYSNWNCLASDTSGLVNSIWGMFFSYAPCYYNSYLVSGKNGFNRFDPITNSLNLHTYHFIDSNLIVRGRVMGAYLINNDLGRTATNFTVEQGMGDLANKNLFGIYTPAGDGYKYSTVSGYNYAYMFFDITGPWE